MRPNIVFCHTDQLAHGTLSAKGDRYVSTPNIDAIRRDGFSFDLAQVSCPTCCPSRASWYTGRMPSESGVLINDVYPLRADLPDLGGWMGARGYDCWYAGKWHVTGRDVSDGFKMMYPHHGHGEKDDDHIAQVGEALLTRGEGRAPFFLNVGFQNPHDICYMDLARDHLAMKVGVESELEEELPPLPPTYDPSMPIPVRYPEAMDWGPREVRLYNYYYYRMIEMGDRAIGRLYRAVQNSPQRDNTLFIFSSDHGELRGHHNRLKKGLLWDEAIRVPLTFVWPGRIPAGRVDDEHCVTSVDVTSTILDFAELPSMPDMSLAGSLRPFLEGETSAPWREYTPAESNQGGMQQSFRDRQYKSIFNFEQNWVKLFDYRNDPFEGDDLAKNERYAHILLSHRNYLLDYNENLIQWSEAYRSEFAKRGIPTDLNESF